MKRIKEIMSRNVKTCSPTTTLKDVARDMEQLDIGMMPVSENERIIGTITDRDIVVRCVAKGGDTNNLTARHAMTEGVEYAYENDGVDEAARLMSERQVQRLLILSDAKEMVGVVSFKDLSQHVQSPQTVAGAVEGVKRL